MKWSSIKPLKSETLIDEFERLRKYKFPNSFREFVKINNGGGPEPYIFDTEESEGRVFGFLYSFNKEDIGLTMWTSHESYLIQLQDALLDDRKWYDALLEIFERYIPFANTEFGDDIAFDKTDNSVVFIDHEMLEVEKIADSFDEFINCFYDDDDFE